MAKHGKKYLEAKAKVDQDTFYTAQRSAAVG